MEWVFTLLKWIAYGLLGVFALLAAAFVFELIYRIWRQVIRGEVRLDESERDLCDVANEILGRNDKVEIGAWLKREEYGRVAREVKRRYLENGRATSRGPGR